MEFSNTLPITVVDVIPSQTDDVQKTIVACYYQCLIDFGNFCLSLISFSVLVILPLIEFVIGIVYLNECSMNFYIPIYLLVSGLISSIIFIFVILGRIFIWPLLNDFKLKTIKSVLTNTSIVNQMIFTLAIFFILFAVAWFITGNIWIFRSQSTVQYTNYIGSPRTYCNRVVYLTGFGTIIIKYIFLWIFICRLNCYLCFSVQNLLNEQNRV